MMNQPTDFDFDGADAWLLEPDDDCDDPSTFVDYFIDDDDDD